jgi:STE24 endopeptidase
MGMNLYGTIILVTLVSTFLIKLLADVLNLRAASPAIPDVFVGVYEQDAYRRSQEYLRANTLFSLVEASFDLALLLVFWFAGGFNLLDQYIRGFGFDTVIAGVLFIGALLLLQSVAGLPFSIYQTFVLEERFGFNKTTPQVFVVDLFKGLLLAAVLGSPLLALIIWFFDRSGSLAWLWAWSGVTIFSLLLQYVAPSVIMPMFNKFTPLEDGPLRQAILRYADDVRFPISGIYVIDGSKRSAKANAFFTGFGRHKRIALFDTLIANHTQEELVAVLAHEIGHFKKRHILVSMVLSMLNLGVVFFLLSLFMNNSRLSDAFYMQEVSVYSSLLFFMLLYSPVEFILAVLLQMLSRRHEFQADRFAVTTHTGGRSLSEALKKLSKSNLSNLTPHPFYVFLNYSHPPVLQRILRIEAEASRNHS